MSAPDFKEGDEIECIEDQNYENVRLTIGKIYICKRYSQHDTLCTVVCDGGYDIEVYTLRFKKYIPPLPIQDNEFVKMMCSNERMIDLPI